MRDCKVLCFVIALVLLNVNGCVNGEDPYRFFTWKVTYGDIYPLGVKQQVLFSFILSFLFLLFFLAFGSKKNVFFLSCLNECERNGCRVS